MESTRCEGNLVLESAHAYNDVVLDRQALVQLLRQLEPTLWTDAKIDRVLESAGRDGRVRYRDLMDWAASTSRQKITLNVQVTSGKALFDVHVESSWTGMLVKAAISHSISPSQFVSRMYFGGHPFDDFATVEGLGLKSGTTILVDVCDRPICGPVHSEIEALRQEFSRLEQALANERAEHTSRLERHQGEIKSLEHALAKEKKEYSARLAKHEDEVRALRDDIVDLREHLKANNLVEPSDTRAALAATAPSSVSSPVKRESTGPRPTPSRSLSRSKVTLGGVALVQALLDDASSSSGSPTLSPSLMERRKKNIGTLMIDSGPRPSVAHGEASTQGRKIDDMTNEEHAPQLVRKESRRETFLRELEDRSNNDVLVEPMTDTRHGVRAWGIVDPDRRSLWHRRKSEVRSIQQVQALKLTKLAEVPESPKRAPSRRSNKFKNAFEPIGEDEMVRGWSKITDASLAQGIPKKRLDPQAFLSGTH